MNAVIYARVSTEKQSREDKVSITEQLEACRKLAHEAGLAVVCEVVDKDKYRSENGRMVQPSGTRADRPGFVKLLELVKGKRARVVIAWAQDRIGRGGSTVSVFRDAVEAAGCEVRFASGQWDAETSELLGAISGMELRKIRARLRLGKIGNVKRGLHMGPVPYGYRTVRNEYGDRVGYEIVPEEAAVLHEMARLYCQHMSLVRIAQKLPKTKRGTAWQRQVISTTLQNSFYYGLVGWGGVAAKGVQPRIWSESEWLALQREHEWRSVNKRTRPRYRMTAYRLAGVLRCGVCGKMLRGHGQHQGDRMQVGYVCRGRFDYLSGATDTPHPPVYIAERKALKQIAAMLGQLTDEDLKAAALGATIPTVRADIDSLRARENELRATLDNLRGLGLPAAARSVEAELARVVQELDEGQANSERASALETGGVLERMRELRDLFAGGGWEAIEAGELNRLLLDTVAGGLSVNEGRVS